MTSCCSWVSLASIKSTITHHSSTFPNPRPSMIIASKVGLLMGDVALCVGRSWLFTDFFPSLDVIAVTLAFETLGHFFECWHSLGTLRMFLRCGFNHPFMDLKHAEWGFISSDGLNGSYLLHGCTLRTKICLGGIPDCKSLPGGAFELRWCLDAWDEQCIDDDGTLFQWVMILGSLVLFSSLRQQTPADSRLHQNWSCNASPWRFLSINHSYFLHEGYLKIYMIYITPYESLVFLWRPNTLVKLVGCWRYWTLPSVAILLSWSLRFEVASCWWGTCCYSCFFWCRSCRKKIAKSVIPPNLGEYF